MAGCCCGDERTCCGPNRCLPNQTCDNPLPSSLRINVSGTFSGGACDCLAVDSTMTYDADINQWKMTFTLCGVSYRYRIGCTTDADGWRLSFLNGNESGANQGTCLESGVLQPGGVVMGRASCNPLVLSGSFRTAGISCCGASHLTGFATLNVTVWEE
jgi:hypothetical protein